MRAMTARYVFTEIDTPTGKLNLIANETSLVGILWQTGDYSSAELRAARRDETHPVLMQAAKQLNEYFEAKRTTFDLPLEPHGTEFQKKVWMALREIPFGQTASYGQIARRIGMPTASRAVGAANGRNPLPIVVPCHRVIGSNGSLTEFGGGLENKSILLRLEGIELGLGARGAIPSYTGPT
jgi:methylated-DNA-[protein]-cysteine S-methyltransferase